MSPTQPGPIGTFAAERIIPQNTYERLALANLPPEEAHLEIAMARSLADAVPTPAATRHAAPAATQASEARHGARSMYEPGANAHADLLHALAQSGAHAFQPLQGHASSSSLHEAADLIGTLHRSGAAAGQAPLRLAEIPRHLENADIALSPGIRSPREQGNIGPSSNAQEEADLLRALEESRAAAGMPSMTVDEARAELGKARGETAPPAAPHEKMTEAQSLRYSADMQAAITAASQAAEARKLGMEKMVQLTAN